MNFQLAVDPGTTRTGVIVFQGGTWVSKRLLKPRKDNKLVDLWEQFDDVIFDLEDRYPDCLVEYIAIEDYRGFVRPDRKNSIPVLAEWIGYLRARIECEYPFITTTMIDKGNTPKLKAKQIAIAAGIPKQEEQDIFDAYLVGVLAGFVNG